jgi:membrane protein
MFAAMGLSASIMSNKVVQGVLEIEPFGAAAYTAGRLLPYLFVCVAFTFIYAFIPNTRVRFGSALTGGVFAGVAWQLVGRLFAAFVVGSVKYEAIYSGFAILIMFMIWLYVSWLILLVGAQIAFYHQHPHLTGRRRNAVSAGNAAAERAGLTIMYLVGRSHLAGAAPWTRDRLVDHLGLHADVTGQILDRLTTQRLLVATTGDPAGLVPGRALEAIGLKDVIDAVRGAAPEGVRAPQPVEDCARELDAAVGAALSGRSLRDLLEELEEGTREAPASAG